MCVIVHSPKGTSIDKDRAERLWTRNPDGGGFAYLKADGTFGIQKTMDFKDFWQRYRGTLNNFPESDFLIHMRIATHGTICIENNHPFVVNPTTVMAHNGIISWMPKGGELDIRSDSRMFVDELLPTLPETWLDTPLLRRMVEQAIGTSKLVFHTNNPALSKNVYILNEHAGDWIDDMWFSNTFGVREYTSMARTGTAGVWSNYDQNRKWPPQNEITHHPDGSKSWVSDSGSTWFKQKESHAWTIKYGVRHPDSGRVLNTPPQLGSGVLDPRDDLAAIRDKKPKTKSAKIEAEREQYWELIQPVQWRGNRWTCVQCDCELEENDMWLCACQDTFCMDCLELLNDCLCDGYSMNQAPATEANKMLVESIRHHRESWAKQLEEVM